MYRRVEVTSTGEVQIREREPAPVPAGSVRLAVSFCSVNRGDIERISGSYGGIDSSAFSFWRTSDGFFVPGYEPVGTVVETGQAVDPALLGRHALLHSHESCWECRYCRAGADNLCGKMRVFGVGTPGLGGWSEEVVVPASQLLLMRDDVDLAAACTYEVTYGTVLHNLRRGLELAKLPGPVVVRGAPGALALAAAQFCVALQVPCAVIVRNPDSARITQFRQLVPEAAVVGEQGGTKAARQAVGGPPAVVIEPLGGDYVDMDIDLVARGGAIGILGAHVGADATLRSDLLFLKGITLYGTPRAPLAEMSELADRIAEGFVTPVIDRIFDMTEVKEALDYCEHPAGIGRVLLAMNGAPSRDHGSR